MIYVFTWRANGTTHKAEIEAEVYSKACWLLGQRQATEFLRDGAPADFEMRLDDEQARLSDEEPPICDIITRAGVPIAG